MRAQESFEITPLGASRAQRHDVRVVAATHTDLAAKVADGSFRRDLYARLCDLVLEATSPHSPVNRYALATPLASLPPQLSPAGRNSIAASVAPGSRFGPMRSGWRVPSGATCVTLAT